MVSRPHGGRLVNRVAKGNRRQRLLEEARELPKIPVDLHRAIDLEDIAYGAFSPLEGFLVEDDYLNVLDNMRLSNDLPWTIPIVLDVNPQQLQGLREGDDVALVYRGDPLAVMRVENIYDWDKKEFSVKVFKTDSMKHPGAARTYQREDKLVGGEIDLINNVPNPFQEYTLWPAETRVLFEERGWKRIVAFQTRNVPHRGHEFVQKAALTFTDGLLIHPLIGWKKPGDYRDEVILAAYKTLIKHYYPQNVVVLSALRMNMNYAGPREAIHHAIVRKNFGATHFIVGRDHAGVKDFYGPYEAWEIFREFPDLGITPLFIREAFYCKKCGGMVTEKTCPHGGEYRVKISGTRIREMLKRGEIPPGEMMRPEVAKVLLSFDKLFVEEQRRD